MQTRNPQSLNGALKILTNDYQMEATRSTSTLPNKKPNAPVYQNRYMGTIPKDQQFVQPVHIPTFTPPRQATLFQKSPINQRSRQPEPTPMSISTRNTYQTRPNTRIRNELHNVENIDFEENEIDQNFDEQNYFEQDTQIQEENQSENNSFLELGQNQNSEKS